MMGWHVNTFGLASINGFAKLNIFNTTYLIMQNNQVLVPFSQNIVEFLEVN
jgi:hypothetical protein